jgi:hypothetical protein
MLQYLKTAGKVTMIVLVALIILGYVVVQYGIVGAEFAGLVQVKLSKLRSYALTFSGVTLRIWLPLLMIPFEFETAYPMVAWLAWVPNLLVAEWAIRRRATKAKKQASRSTPIVE